MIEVSLLLNLSKMLTHLQTPSLRHLLQNYSLEHTRNCILNSRLLKRVSHKKKQNYDLKIPDVEKSLALVKNLQSKQEAGESVTTRYNLADNVYGKAEVDTSVGIVNLWLGANVMLEYTYQEAIDFLSQNLESARREFKIVKEDLAFVRDQIVTSEVSMTRIFNWDVRKKRVDGTLDASSS
mmetsp:Transcript_45388/g.94482  ORF Transcript_45388/g.94482 Transcript_45388/m.94482 type:complete len:181 (-) Transcript_45388:375-917(-)